ncbi:MAG: hypothetical protein ACFCGT_20155 [Sandaracinaceae bacterium]
MDMRPMEECTSQPDRWNPEDVLRTVLPFDPTTVAHLGGELRPDPAPRGPRRRYVAGAIAALLAAVGLGLGAGFALGSAPPAPAALVAVDTPTPERTLGAVLFPSASGDLAVAASEAAPAAATAVERPAHRPRSTPRAPRPAPREARDAPTRDEVSAAMATVRANVQACGQASGVVRVAVTFRGETGRVGYAQVEAGSAEPQVASCIARAVRNARVEPFTQRSFTVHYPYAL